MKRRLAIAALLPAVLLGAAVPLYFRYLRYPPLAARLLPEEADAYIYVDLRPVRQFTEIKTGALLAPEEVESFIAETGISPERDLDEAAIAVLPLEAAPAGGLERRFAQMLVGRFDRARLEKYLRGKAQRIERYRGTDVFLIGHEGRTIRVGIVNDRMVAVSNSSSSESIRHALDRYPHAGFPRGEADRLRRHYRKVPVGAVAWAVVRMNNPQGGFFPLLGGYEFPLPRNTDVIVSARVLSSLELRAEAKVTREREAARIADQINSYLILFRAIEATTSPKGPDPDAKQLFENLRVERDGAKVTVTAEVPLRFLQKLVASPEKQTQRREDAKEYE